MSFLTETSPAFLQHFGEQVTYIAANGGRRKIVANVDRTLPATLPGVPAAHTPSMVVHVRNSRTSITDDDYGGISSREIDTGGDCIEMVDRNNKSTLIRRRIVSIVSVDDGMVGLGVR